MWVPDRYLESETTLARQEQFEVNALNAQLVEEQHLGEPGKVDTMCDWHFASHLLPRLDAKEWDVANKQRKSVIYRYILQLKYVAGGVSVLLIL